MNGAYESDFSGFDLPSEDVEIPTARRIPPPPAPGQPGAAVGGAEVQVPLARAPQRPQRPGGPVRPPAGPLSRTPGVAPAPASVAAPVPLAPPAAAAPSRPVRKTQVVNVLPDEGRREMYARFEGAIVDITATVQAELVKKNQTADLVAARHDPVKHEEIRKEVHAAALRVASARGQGSNDFIADAVADEILGLGPLQPLWANPEITEVIANGPNEVYVEIKGKLLPAPGYRFRDADHMLLVIQRILSPLNRNLNRTDPLTDGRLPDGSRVNAVDVSIAPAGPLLTIRRFPDVRMSLVDLVAVGAMTKEIAQDLAFLVANKASALIVGGTSTGKTTMLSALSAAIPSQERVITIEDSLELRLAESAHVAAMEARPPDNAGRNAVPIRALVKNALRQRPDRIIVGEVRGEEALDMLVACNTGHEGSMSTIHANGPNDAISRLAVMLAQGGEMPADKVDWLVGSALDILVQIRKYKDGSRRISGVYEVPSTDTLGPNEKLRVRPIWEWKTTGITPDGVIVGEYAKVNEISEELRERLNLDFETPFTWEQIQSMNRH